MIQPTLKHLGLMSDQAERLVLGTALVESNLHALDQSSDGKLGPAYGLFQIEPWVLDDLWDRYLRAKPELKEKVAALLAPAPSMHMQLVTNMAFATAMCRVHYLQRPAAIPNGTHDQAEYWKRYYNTIHGKGDPAHFVRAWRLAGLPLV